MLKTGEQLPHILAVQPLIHCEEHQIPAGRNDRIVIGNLLVIGITALPIPFQDSFSRISAANAAAG